MLEISYGTVVEKYHIYEPPAVKYAIVRQHPFGRTGDLAFKPDTCAMQNPRENGFPGPADIGKGDLIPITASTWRYMEIVNAPYPGGYKYTRAKNALWINDRDWDNETPYNPGWAESVEVGGNFVSYDFESSTHIRLVAYSWGMDMMAELDPLVDNWLYHPVKWIKAQAIDENGVIRKVGAGVDAFFSLIVGRKELWMAKQDVELFPDGPDYRLYGTDVYNGNTPLLVNGVFYNGWSLQTKGVIPPG